MRPPLAELALSVLIGATGCDDLLGPDHRFSPEEVSYYLDVAIGTEYGDADPVIHKWGDEIVVYVSGKPGQADMQELDRVIDDLNRLLDGPDIRTTARRESPNLRIHFAPESTFADVLHQYVPVNRGFFWFHTDETAEIIEADVLIDNTDAISQVSRNHLIREEFTQALGLARVTEEFPESIFGPAGPTPTEYAPIDRTVIRIHDLPVIRPGMTEDAVWEVLW